MWVNVIYVFDILIGTYVKKRVFICMCVHDIKFTQNFENLMDNVGNLLKKLFVAFCCYNLTSLMTVQ